MASNIRQYQKRELNIYKPTNISELIKRSKVDQKREKRKTILLALASISALTISGLIISL